MMDADIEYLVRALSDARSRAAEITVSVRARLGVEHRLGELGNAAVSKIELLLAEIRMFAMSDSETSAPVTGPPTIMSEPAAPVSVHTSSSGVEWFPLGTLAKPS